jgi:hypothetical protein
MDAVKKIQGQARLLCNNRLQTQQTTAPKRNISPLAEIKKLAASTVRPPSSAD